MKNPASVATTPVASLPAPASGRGWFEAFRDLSREHGFEPLRIEGQIPAQLSGTLYRNGPALFENFGRRYEHWFDGDGAVGAVRLSGGKAEGAGAVGRAHFDHPLPFTFHGVWLPAKGN
jgi:all-trans-8'-apo-beta-carotenal 15,15'-oxygenase